MGARGVINSQVSLRIEELQMCLTTPFKATESGIDGAH